MSEAVLNVHPRNETGKQFSKRLRREGRLPGIFYFHGEDSIKLSLDRKELVKLLSSEVGVLNLKFDDDNERQCVIREVQYNPVSNYPVHIDFLGIKRGEKITLVIPIHLVGTPKGVKDGGCILEQSTREIEIECLPRYIPEHLEIDVTSLDIGQTLHVSDINYENITILSDAERLIATVVAPRVTRAGEAEAPEGVAAEPEVIGKGGSQVKEGE